MTGASAHCWRCPCCGEEFVGLPMVLGFDSPAGWDDLDDHSRAASLLDEDVCIIRRANGPIEHYIRALLELPIVAEAESFRWLVWLSVSKSSHEAYSAGLETGEYSGPGCFGYLSHEIPDYGGSYGLHADVWFQPDGVRPQVILHASDHPLAEVQQSGIPLRQVERWAALMHGVG